MKRPKRAIRIVKRKAEHGNPKDYCKVELFPSPIGSIVIIDDQIIINGKMIKNE